MSIATPFSRVARQFAPPPMAVGGDEVRAVILLNGAIGSSALSRQVCRSILDLPVGSGLTVVGLWRRHLLRSGLMQQSPAPSVRLINSQSARVAQGIAAGADPMFRCEYDPVELRGTGGVLRDIATEYPDHAYLLAVSAAQILFEPLDQVIAALRRPEADVSFFVHDDGTPAGVTLVRSRCLRCLPEIGFVDFKEQALPRIAASHSVAAIRCERKVAASVRTAEQYIRALRQFHHCGKQSTEDERPRKQAPFAEDWSPAFQVIEDGAIIETGARVHDSVVLSGARVGAGALLVRSVVGPGAIVRHGAVVIDQLVGNGNANASKKGRA
jgi:hypothetical protein